MKGSRKLGSEQGGNSNPAFVFCLFFVVFSVLFGCSAPKTPPSQNVASHEPKSWVDTLTNSPYAEYDRALVGSVRDKWYSRLQPNLDHDLRGDVVEKFKHLPDGTIRDVIVVRSTVNDPAPVKETAASVCRAAIVAASPFRPWTDEMRAFTGDARVIQFTFHFN